MGLYVRDFRELVLEMIGGAQDVGTQGVRRLQHEERLVAFGEYLFEFGRGSRHRIAGNDQAIDGRIGGYPQGAVDTCRSEEHESADDPESRTQHAEENLMHHWQGSHSIKGCALAARREPGGQAPGLPARRNDSLKL